jgi:hypothetical protein
MPLLFGSNLLVYAGFVKGTLNVVNPDTGAIESIKVALPYSTNWE